MIGEDGKAKVYLAYLEWEGGVYEIVSVHDTREGAYKSLGRRGFVSSGTYGSFGEVYTRKGKTADDFPLAFAAEFPLEQ